LIRSSRTGGSWNQRGVECVGTPSKRRRILFLVLVLMRDLLRDCNGSITSEIKGGCLSHYSLLSMVF